MCGISGLIGKNKSGFSFADGTLFTNMLRINSIRGEDSTGAFGVDATGKIDLIKGNTNGYNFTSSKNYIDFSKRIFTSYRVVIGHNRSATFGKVTPKNAHPFKENHIVLVHNGTIRNKDSLSKETEVDSHAITKALAKADAITALNEIDGAFALVWFDQEQKTLNLARNKERPLFLIEYTDYWTISSEPGLPYWLNGREGNVPVKPPLLIPVEKIYRFKLDALEKGYEEVDYENYAFKSTYTVPEYQHTSRLHVVSNSTNQFKQGEEVVFKIDDCKWEFGDPSYILFGHPIINGDIDENILIKTEITSKIECDNLQSNKYAMGVISAITEVGTMSVLLVKFVQPHKIHTDANTNISTEDNIKEAIVQGCNRCKGDMSFLDIADSIIRKKKDGTWRTLCKTCLASSLANIPTKNGEIVAQ